MPPEAGWVLADLHLCHTPYHALLAAAVRRDEAHLVMLDDAAGNGHVVAAFAPLFASNVILRGAGRPNLSARARLSRLERHVRSLGPLQRVHVSQDQRAEDQRAAALGEESWFVEDGIVHYIERNTWDPTTDHAGPRALARKAAFGSSWKAIPRPGLGVHAGSWAIRPQALAHPLPAPVRGLVPDALRTPRVRECVEELAAILRARPETWTDARVLLVVDHVDGWGPAYSGSLQAAIAQLRKHDVPFLAKCHPRDPDAAKRLGLAGDLTMVPAGLPAEAVALLAPKLEAVVSDANTPLLSIPWMSPKVRAVSMTKLSHSLRPADQDRLRAAGITVPADATAFAATMEDLACA